MLMSYSPRICWAENIGNDKRADSTLFSMENSITCFRSLCGVNMAILRRSILLRNAPRGYTRHGLFDTTHYLVVIGKFPADLRNGIATSQECIEDLRIKMRAPAFLHDLETPARFEGRFVGAFAAQCVKDIGDRRDAAGQGYF